MTPGLKKYFSCFHRESSSGEIKLDRSSSKIKKKKKTKNANAAINCNSSDNEIVPNNNFLNNNNLSNNNCDVVKFINNSHKVYDKNICNENGRPRNMAFTINVTPRMEKRNRE